MKTKQAWMCVLALALTLGCEMGEMRVATTRAPLAAFETWQSVDPECPLKIRVINASHPWCYDCGYGLYIPEALLCASPGDLNGDGVADLADYRLFLDEFTGPTP
jgi:hypothetical protein